MAYLLEDIGYLNAAEGNSEQAIRLVGAAETLREAIGSPLPPAEKENSEKLLKAARDALSTDAQEAALQFGRSMSLEQAIEFAETTPQSN